MDFHERLAMWLIYGREKLSHGRENMPRSSIENEHEFKEVGRKTCRCGSVTSLPEQYRSHY